MKRMVNFILLVAFSCWLPLTSFGQEESLFMRIVNLKVDAEDLDAFKKALTEDIETAVNTEVGALEIYALYDIKDSTKITVIETFLSMDAHAAHQETSHYLKFKNSTNGMVKSVEYSVVVPVTLASKLQAGLVGKKNIQARPPNSQPFGSKAFDSADNTVLRWLGNAGFFINSRGTTIMVDPLLQGFDMPVMIDVPISPQSVPKLDAVLITHADNDHFSIPTLKELTSVTEMFHSTVYVDSLMKNLNFTSIGHQIGEIFEINDVQVRVTPADHAWQNAYPGTSDRIFKNEDSAGFWIETPDGSIWATGDSRLMDEHLTMKTPDAILFDFSDSEWHFTFDGAVKLANAYPNTPLLLHHWGTIDAPDFSPFNGNPADLYDKVVNPERIVLLAPGEPYVLKPLDK